MRESRESERQRRERERERVKKSIKKRITERASRACIRGEGEEERASKREGETSKGEREKSLGFFERKNTREKDKTEEHSRQGREYACT